MQGQSCKNKATLIIDQNKIKGKSLYPVTSFSHHKNGIRVTTTVQLFTMIRHIHVPALPNLIRPTGIVDNDYKKYIMHVFTLGQYSDLIRI